MMLTACFLTTIYTRRVDVRAPTACLSVKNWGGIQRIRLSALGMLSRCWNAGCKNSRRSRSNKPRGSIFFNGPINFRRVHSIRQDLKYSNHIEIESLPGGAWGYGFFEVAVRYLRNLGAETTGMTGRFHRSWGDFGSIRNQAALDYE